MRLPDWLRWRWLIFHFNCRRRPSLLFWPLRLVLVALFLALTVTAWKGHSAFSQGLVTIRVFPPLTHIMTMEALRWWPFDKRFRWEVLLSAARAGASEKAVREAYRWAITAWPHQTAVKRIGEQWKGL